MESWAKAIEAKLLLFETPNWNPNGATGVYDNHNLGVYYGSNEWRIFHQDGVA